MPRVISTCSSHVMALLLNCIGCCGCIWASNNLKRSHAFLTVHVHNTTPTEQHLLMGSAREPLQGPNRHCAQSYLDLLVCMLLQM